MNSAFQQRIAFDLDLALDFAFDLATRAATTTIRLDRPCEELTPAIPPAPVTPPSKATMALRASS